MLNKRYKLDSSQLKLTTAFSKPDHPGIDLVRRDGVKGCPLYSPCDGIVREAVGPGGSPGNFGGADSGLYVAIQAYGNAPDGYLVDKVGHMRDVSVRAGQPVKDGDLIGHEGWTGHVIPDNSAGEHSHNAMFYVHNNDYSHPDYIDPTRFLYGDSMVINPIPQEVTTVNIKVIARYKITEPEIRLRSSPLTTAPIVGKVVAGDVVDATELVDGEGYTWGNTGVGYAALYKGVTPWAVPVPPAAADTSALEEQIRSLGALVDARDARIVLQDADIAAQSAKIEVARNALS